MGGSKSESNLILGLKQICNCMILFSLSCHKIVNAERFLCQKGKNLHFSYTSKSINGHLGRFISWSYKIDQVYKRYCSVASPMVVFLIGQSTSDSRYVTQLRFENRHGVKAFEIQNFNPRIHLNESHFTLKIIILSRTNDSSERWGLHLNPEFKFNESQ